MGDGGCGTGAALLAFDRPRGAGRAARTTSTSGRRYADDEIEAALQRAQPAASSRYAPIEPKIAQLLAAGKVIARFDGRMEYGPRALGNRSILYHAREPEVNQWLNQRLGRTEFMPFAPATLWRAPRPAATRTSSGAEHAAEFMTITFDCTEFMKRDCPGRGARRRHRAAAAGRPRATNPSFHEILTEYHAAHRASRR